MLRFTYSYWPARALRCRPASASSSSTTSSPPRARSSRCSRRSSHPGRNSCWPPSSRIERARSRRHVPDEWSDVSCHGALDAQAADVRARLIDLSGLRRRSHRPRARRRAAETHGPALVWARKRNHPGAGRGRQVDAVGCGGRIRTADLRVMSPTSYRCSTPRRLTVREGRRSVKHGGEGWAIGCAGRRPWCRRWPRRASDSLRLGSCWASGRCRPIPSSRPSCVGPDHEHHGLPQESHGAPARQGRELRPNVVTDEAPFHGHSMVLHRCPWLFAPRRNGGIRSLHRAPEHVCSETVVRPVGSGVDDQLDPVAAAR